MYAMTNRVTMDSVYLWGTMIITVCAKTVSLAILAKVVGCALKQINLPFLAAMYRKRILWFGLPMQTNII